MLPSGAVARMSSFAFVELKVIECGPITYQVTDPPTGILIVFGPNSVIAAGALDAGAPEPARTMVPLGVAIGAGACPWRSAATADSSGASNDASRRCPAANCALGLGTAVLDGTTTTFPDISSRWSRHMKR